MTDTKIFGADVVARFFRASNSKLFYIDNIVVEKLLKVILKLSSIVYQRNKPSKGSQGQLVVIDNFDSSIKMCIDISRSMGAAIYWTGFHEFREFLFLHRFLKPEMVFIDVGANQGEYTLFAAKRLTNGKVLPFEPLPSILKLLRQNIEVNRFANIEVYECGLSDRNEQLNIFEIDDAHEGLATFFPGSRKKGIEYSVPLRRLDDIVAERKIERLDFIKLDIEGGELKALLGAAESIEQFKPVVMIEINKETYTAAGYSVDDVKEFFTRRSYKAFELQKRGQLKECQSLPDFGNIVFRFEERAG